MRTFLSILLIGPALAAAGQSLTMAEVYDYQPGDMFQRRNLASGAGGPVGPPTYITDSIMERFTSADGDTLFYRTKLTVYQPPSGPGLPPFYSQVVDTVRYTDLNSPAQHISLPNPCAPPEDSIGISDAYCGRQTWVSYANNDAGCFEPDVWTSELVRGCGGPYYWSFQPAGPLELRGELIYFRKGTEECGDLITGVAEAWNMPLVRLYPMPSMGTLFAEGADGFRYTLTDVAGRSVAQGRVEAGRIELNTVPAGHYLVDLRDAHGQRVTQPVVVE